ncbi:DUF1501 domain-containing protein [Aureliella helgolandensis]|nr:DUF1501 domain-containing protein [Aureliella helgolandensis]
MAISPSGWLKSLAAAASVMPSPKKVILLWLNGGPATIDLWDLKPGHVNGGPFSETATRVPGLRISEHLPELARCSDQLAVVRSMTSKEGDHSRATHFARTGYVPQAGIDFPDLGALLVHEQGASDSPLPNYVSILPPRRVAFAGNGFLESRCAPLYVGEQADAIADLTVRDLQPDRMLPLDRRNLRQQILQQLDTDFSGMHRQPVVLAGADVRRRAIRMMQPEVVEAFDLEAEPERARDRLGRNLFGQGCVMARRLLERGVSFVEVTLDGWDTHNQNFQQVIQLSGQLDRALSGLIADLAERGMLDSTLIVCLGEFGRTPVINSNSGRDHWPRAWSTVLAGGGVGRGQVIGATSADGLQVESEPYQVPDLIASICHAIGVDPMQQNDSNVDRPIRIADPSARLIEGLF